MAAWVHHLLCEPQLLPQLSAMVLFHCSGGAVSHMVAAKSRHAAVALPLETGFDLSQEACLDWEPEPTPGHTT